MLVKVFSQNRKTRIFVRAECLEDLIREGRRKLKLDGEYLVFTEEDGILIDDEEVFQELGKEFSSQLSVMLLPPTSQWKSLSEKDDSSQVDTPTNSDSTSSDELSHSESDSFSSTSGTPRTPTSSPRITGFPISRALSFLEPLIEIMDSSTRVPFNFPTMKMRAIRETFHFVGNFMLLDLKDYSKQTATKLANYIVDYENGKFSRIFEVSVGTEVSDTGHKCFAQQIYAYVQANKPPELKTRKRKKSGEENSEEDADDLGLAPPPPTKQDKYGCVAYELPLPVGETAESQEKKREEALEYFADSLEAANLMALTYASQRTEINRAKPMIRHLPKVLDRWPLLKLKSHLLKHAETLMGKDVTGVWLKNVGERWANIFSYMEAYWAKEALGGKCGALSNLMVSLIKTAKSADIASRAIGSKCAACFLLIVGFMREKEAAFHTVLEATASDDEVLEAGAASHGYPILVVRGESLCDPEATFDIVVAKASIQAADAVEGALILFLCYFVFNCDYHPDLHSSLEFYQRFFLQVNPPTGNKRSKQKRTVDSVDAKVKTLSRNIQNHSSLWLL